MKNVELVRRRLVNGLSNEMVRFRSWISGVETGEPAIVEKLKGKEGDELIAEVTESVMRHLGHSTSLDGDRKQQSKARQAAAGAMGR